MSNFHLCCRDCLHRTDWLDRSRLFQQTIDSCRCFSAHLETCVVAIDLESNRSFLIQLLRNILIVSLSGTIFGLYIYKVATQGFLFIGIESSVVCVGLLYISFIVDCEERKEPNDQRASLRVDTRETQQPKWWEGSDPKTRDLPQAAIRLSVAICPIFMSSMIHHAIILMRLPDIIRSTMR